MWERLTIKILNRMLHSIRLSAEGRNQCAALLIRELNGFAVRDIIRIDGDGTVYINDQKLTLESAIRLREGAKVILESSTRQFIRDQVAFRAINIGVHNGDTPEKVMFSRAALWWGQQETELLQILAQQ